jgi:15-cis-phytoene synthase
MNVAVQQLPTPFSPTESQLAVAYSVCSGIARLAARNFYYGFLALPKRKRQALCAVYAFMRRCDDIADDETLPARDRQQKLYEWLGAFHRVHAGEPTDDPVLLALTDAQQKFGIPVGLLDELAFGTAKDVDQQIEEEIAARAEGRSPSSPSGLIVQYGSFEELRRYCYSVASVVGLVCIRIFGYHDPEAEPLAERCGLAFQLTNIIRDVREDAEVGRVYLPEEDLARFAMTPADFREPWNSRRFAPLLAFEADRARECYAAGEQLIPYIDEDSQPALWVLVTIYRSLLEKIAARQFNVFSGKIRLTARQKLTILAKGVAKRLL